MKAVRERKQSKNGSHGLLTMLHRGLDFFTVVVDLHNSN